MAPAGVVDFLRRLVGSITLKDLLKFFSLRVELVETPAFSGYSLWT